MLSTSQESTFYGYKEQLHLILLDFKSFLSLFKNMTYHILDTHVIQEISAQSLSHMRLRSGKQDFVEI